MAWYRKVIERTRPTFISEIGMLWSLLDTRWFGLAIVVRSRSDSTFDQRSEVNRFQYVIEGACVVHREVARLGDHEAAEPTPKDAYLSGNRFGLWSARRKTAGGWWTETQGRRGGVELVPRGPHDNILDLPWMPLGSIEVNQEQPLVLLSLVWGKHWRGE